MWDSNSNDNAGGSFEMNLDCQMHAEQPCEIWTISVQYNHLGVQDPFSFKSTEASIRSEHRRITFTTIPQYGGERTASSSAFVLQVSYLRETSGLWRWTAGASRGCGRYLAIPQPNHLVMTQLLLFLWEGIKNHTTKTKKEHHLDLTNIHFPSCFILHNQVC